MLAPPDQPIHLWCLHGNLQRPEVWADLKKALETPHLRVRLEDLMATQAEGFEAWTEAFCAQVSAGPDANHILLGYSLGGRLSLHALLSCPSLWSGAVVVGADPGLKDDAARAAQLGRDRAWAERWLTQDWDGLWRDWDAQGVFGGRPNPAPRPEAAYSRAQIARLFEVFSKGHQADLRPRLAALTAPPILYLSGEDDAKYRALGDELSHLCSALTHRVVPGAAHRVPWEAPEAFTRLVRAFLERGAEVRAS